MEWVKPWNHKTVKLIVILMTQSSDRNHETTKPCTHKTKKPRNHVTYSHYDDSEMEWAKPWNNETRDGVGETMEPQNRETYRHLDDPE